MAQWADSSLFWASMGYTLSPKGAKALFGDSPDQGQAFANDRAAMRQNMTLLRPADATSAYRSAVARSLLLKALLEIAGQGGTRLIAGRLEAAE